MRRHTFFERFSKCTHQSSCSTALLILRVVLGAMFFYAGVTKFGDWTASGYLAGATGPLAEFFQSLAGSPVVDSLNAWGLTLVGACLILGIFVRPASFFGISIMILYYLSDFTGNTAHGLIDQHIIYSVILLLFLAGGVGHIFGLDGLIHDNARKKTWYIELLFG